MFAVIHCPVCQHKSTVPEGEMGKRQICPNCKSPFLAGKSVTEEAAPMRYEPAAAGVNKTMLGETGPPIQYNCPRCKKALEAPALEAGTKKPCPACGQRLQVPAVSAPAAASAPAINKTMLGETGPPIQYNCPTCKKPLESPASEAGVKKPCPACGQRLQVPLASSGGPARPNLNKTILASDESKPQPGAYSAGAMPTSAAVPGQAAGDALPFYKKPYGMAAIGAGGLVLLLLLMCLVTAPGANAEREKFKQAQLELENTKKELAELKTKMQMEKDAVSKTTASADSIRAEFERQRESSNRDYQAALLQNQNKEAQALAKEQHEKMMRKIEADRREALDKQDRDAAKRKMEMEILERRLKDATDRPPVIQYAPPPYYHRWHPAYGWGYW